MFWSGISSELTSADAVLERDGLEALPAGLAADGVDAERDEGVLHLAQRLDLHVGVLHVEVDAGDVQVLAQLLDGVALAGDDLLLGGHLLASCAMPSLCWEVAREMRSSE